MPNPSADYPAALHTNTDVSGFGSTALGSSSTTHVDLEGKQEEEITAVQTKIGTGASTPTATNKILGGTGIGTTAWDTPANVGLSETGHTHTESDITDLAHTPEGTAILSTGEVGGTKFLREDGDGTSSWQAVPGGGDALTANPLSQFAATTSAQLAGVISDETGSGAAVFATSPTLVTPALGTPASGVMTNVTGTAASLTAGNATQASALKSATTTVNVDSATAPTTGQVLTATGASAATWQTPAGGGGQSTYDVIIAASGGDYTTLDAYFQDAPSAGDRIWVNDSFTWGTLNVNSSLTNLTIEGPGPEHVRIDLATNNKRLGLSGAGCTVRGIGFDGGTGTSAYFNMTGADALCENVEYTSAQPAIKNLNFTGARTRVQNCRFISTYTGATTNSAYVYFTSANGVFANNYVEGQGVSPNANQGIYYNSGSNSVTTGNTFVMNNSQADADTFVSLAGVNLTFSGNTLINNDVTKDAVMIAAVCSESAITGNTFAGFMDKGIEIGAGENTITGNVIISDNITSSEGVHIDAGDDNVVVGNRIKGCATGILIDAGSNRTNASSNALNGNTASVTDNGTSTVVDGTNS